MAPAQTTYPSRDLASHLDVLFFINLGEQIFTVGVELECPVPIGPGVCRSHGGHLSDEIFVASDERVGSDTGGGAFHLDQSRVCSNTEMPGTYHILCRLQTDTGDLAR